MAIDQLALYNRALRIVGDRKLSSLAEDREPRYRLDDAWAFNAVDYCLELVKPRFASRVDNLVSAVASSEHGFDNVFTLPSDYVAMVAVYSSGTLDEPITKYLIEGNTIAVKTHTSIFVRYTSNDASYGTNYANYPTSFAEVVATYLAQQITPRTKPDLIGALEEALANAVEASRNRDGEEEPSQWAPDRTIASSVTQLGIYNRALRTLGVRALGSLTEENEVRYRLDDAWGFGAINYCLEVVKPRFATIVSKLTSSTTSAQHGFNNVFTLPSDYVAMVGVFSTADLDEPVTKYFVEGRTIATDHSTTYIRYTSNNASYGSDLTIWPTTFGEVAGAYLASQLVIDVKPEAVDAVASVLTNAINFARKIDGEEEPAYRSTKSNTTLTSDWYQIYNDALFILGLPQLISVNDDSERRVRLDHAVNQGAVKFHLEDTNWSWAISSDQIDYDVSVEPSWGFSYAFEKPGGMYRIVGVFTDEYMTTPVKPYADEGDYIFAEYQTIYLQYISSDVIPDPQLWPAYFRKLIAAYLAKVIGATMKNDVDKSTLQRADDEYHDRMRNAQSNDATQAPPRILSDGSWSRARWGGTSRRGYRGRP